MEITYYRAIQNDLQILVDYRLKFLIDILGEQSEEMIAGLKKNLESYYSDTFKNDSYISYIAKSGDEVVGIGGMLLNNQAGNFKNPSGKIGYIMNMYTVPSFRKKGICSAILKKLSAEAEKRGITLLELHATKEGEPVYVQQGFKKHPEPRYRKYISSMV